MLPFLPASMAMNVRLLLCILGLFALSLAPARAQIAPVASPSGPVPAGPYVVVDVATGEALLDRELLTHALTNLLSNAIKFTPEGGKVTVRASGGGIHGQAEAMPLLPQ